MLLLAGLVLLLGCDQADLKPPEPPPAGDQFETYVAIGNSITAGFQSDGLSAATQLESYAVKVAEQIGTEFNSPLFAAPGCPPPLKNPFTGARVGNGTASTCALRQLPAPEVLHNVSVPGATVIDVLSVFHPDADPTALTLPILGGRTQIEAVADADPTFVSVWIGDNDVLSASLSGNATRITPVATFRDRYEALLDSLDQIGVEGGVLIAVGDVTLIPHQSPGAAYWDVRANLPFSVDGNCAPSDAGNTTLVPFGYAFGTLFREAQQGASVTLDCVNDPEVLTGAEVQTLQSTVQAYNLFIEEKAQERGWAFVNVNPLFQSLRASGDIPAFPNVDQPTQAFGEFFSLDGVHPSGLAHRVVANEVITAINDTYGTDIERLSNVPVGP